MMNRKTWMSRVFLAAVAIAALGQTARAGILPVSVSVIPEAGNFRWTYSIVLPTDMKLQAGDYFTIYDFAGLKSGSASVTSTGPDSTYSQFWSFSSPKVGPTPARLNPNDDPNIENISWTYNGPTIDINGKITLGNFSAASSLGLDKGGDSFLTAKNPRSADGVFDSNITATMVPTGAVPTTPGVPEPTTLALAGLGLPLVGASRFIRRKLKA